MKRHSLANYLYIFYSTVFVLYIINVFIENTSLNYLIGLLAIVMVAVSFPKASTLFKILGGAFISIGGFFYLQTNQPVVELPIILTSNMSLLLLLAMLPWMNSVVRSGRFDQSIKALLEVNVTDLGKLYGRSSGAIVTLASFLNLSAASISQDVLKDNLSHVNKKLRDSFISISTLRGYSLAILWSPLEVLLATSIFVTGVDYISILPWLLLIAAILFILDATWGRFHYKKYPYQNEKAVVTKNINRKGLAKKLSHFILALVLFLTLVLILGNVIELDFILTVTLLIFPFSFVWSLIMKRRHSFWVIGWNTWKAQTNNMQNFIVLFISLSLFSEGIGNTTFLEYLQQPVMALSDYPLAVFFLIQVIFIFLSMFGIHPLATIGLLGSLLGTLLTVYNPLSIAIVLVTSAIATLTVGTYGLIVTLTAISLNMSPYRITIDNLIYSFVYGGVGSIIAYMLL